MPKRFTLLVFFYLFMICRASGVHADSLGVFYPTSATVSSMQKKLSQELSNLTVVVFGRYEDFINYAVANPDSFLLSKQCVIKSVPTHEIKAEGYLEGSNKEPWLLISVDNPVPMDKLETMSVGVLNLLGRKGTTSFVTGYLKSAPKIKRANKVEDLVFLSIYKMVDVLFVPQSLISGFKENSGLNFVISSAHDMKVGIIALAGKKEANADDVIRRLNGITDMNELGIYIDYWKKIK